MYLIIGKAIGHIEESNGNKYLDLDSAELHSSDENKEVLKKYKELWDGMKSKFNDEWKYGKDFVKIKFDTDDDLPCWQ